MFEKVNPCHPDKVADRIAGALVDLAYSKEENPRIAVEVLIGHGKCHIISETSVHLAQHDVKAAVRRIAGDGVVVDYSENAQDKHLAENQDTEIRCGDNGIFKGCPVSREQKRLTSVAEVIYNTYHSDGKYIFNEFDGNTLIVCQSNVSSDDMQKQAIFNAFGNVVINPIGDWTGGTNVDSGETNRKLGSDMGDGVTGGGLHGKDLSKADVCVNIYCHQLAQILNRPVEAYCAIGDTFVNINGAVVPYSQIVSAAREYITRIGGFEKFAEWGLIRISQ